MSPVRRDWLERLLSQLAEVLARALGYRARGEEAQWDWHPGVPAGKLPGP